MKQALLGFGSREHQYLLIETPADGRIDIFVIDLRTKMILNERINIFATYLKRNVNTLIKAVEIRQSPLRKEGSLMT
jgi:hypothetical protein